VFLQNETGIFVRIAEAVVSSQVFATQVTPDTTVVL
jgi:hypothetical protein